jgi:hypothetical protein
VAEGYDTTEYLRDAPIEDLVGDCGLKKPHARKIIKHLSEQQPGL